MLLSFLTIHLVSKNCNCIWKFQYYIKPAR